MNGYGRQYKRRGKNVMQNAMEIYYHDGVKAVYIQAISYEFTEHYLQATDEHGFRHTIPIHRLIRTKERARQ